MGLLTDILREIPLSAVLKEKVAAIEAEKARLETDNAILKDDLREAKTKIAQLEKRLQPKGHPADVDETDALLLKEIALAGDTDCSAQYLAGKVGLSATVIELRLQRLCDTEYLTAWSLGGPDCYSLLPKSRAYLVGNNLI